jgi:hypothetical protein
MILKQLLARSTTLLLKNQMIGLKTKDKSRITIHELSTLHKTYKHTLEFRNIYEETSRELKKKK